MRYGRFFLFSSKNMRFFDEARSIFVDVHAADENGFDLFFAVRGEKLCEAF